MTGALSYPDDLLRRVFAETTTAAVVGVLVEVPVMLSLVWFANRTTHWFPAEETAIRAPRTREQN